MKGNTNTNWSEIIKAKVSLSDHIAKYCDIKQIGSKWQGNHGNKHDSKGGLCLGIFNTGESDIGKSQAWNCYNCKTGGDVIEFGMDYNNIDYKTACLNLGNLYGIDLPQKSNVHLSEEEKKRLEEQKELSNDSQNFLNDACQW